MITSNTIVKNGMPFIGKVLEQVESFMDRMVITISEKADKETKKVVNDFKKRYKKVILLTENVDNVGKLTDERNRQLEYVDTEWILFLDDDDYWPESQLKNCMKLLNRDKETLAYAVSPYQLLDEETYDHLESRRYYSKFLRKTPDLHYLRRWPRDMPADGNGKFLHWRGHPKVSILPYKFYHLSYLKDYSFREGKGFEHFNKRKIMPRHLPKKAKFL